MSNYPAPVGDSAISGLSPVTTPLTIHDLLIISIKLNDAYYTGKVTLEQIRRFFLDNTLALEISGMIALLDGKSNTDHKHVVADITDMPQLMATKANATHSHTTAQITGLATLLEGKANLIHTHDINSINGLVSALSNKANLTHNHEITDIIGLKPILDSFQEWTSNAGSSHEHQMSQIAGLDERFASKANTQHNHQIENVDGLQDALNNKADVRHTHTAMDFENIGPLLENKADAIHSHALADINGLELALEDKAGKIHVHALDDVDGLRDELNARAPTQHNHPISAVDGLELELGNKSDLNHTHLMVQVEGLEDALSHKAAHEHEHTTADIADFDAVMGTKADTIHTHSIDNVTGLRAALNTAESVTNKVHDLSEPSDVKYVSVNGVIAGVHDILSTYIFPVNSVNGRNGEIILSKDDLGLGQVDNTSDRQKPISDATNLALSDKVDRILNVFDPDSTPGRVTAGDEYVTIIQKLQWQIDVLRGLLVEPIENAIQIIPDGYSLKLIFDKEVKFRNNLLSSNNFSVASLFQEIVTNEFAEEFGFSVDYALISIEAVGKELTITLEPDWIKPSDLAAIDSVDNGGNGTGIVTSLAKLNFRNLISVDGSLTTPVNSEVDLTIHTNISKRGIVHDDTVYSRAVVLGTWAATPHYGYVPPDTILDLFLGTQALIMNFSRDIFIDGVSMAEYEGNSVSLFTRLFKDSAEMQLIVPALVESCIEYTTTEREMQLFLRPGFVSGEVLEQLDTDHDGIYQLTLELDPSVFTSIDEEDIALSRSPTFMMTLYSNASASGKLHTPELYQRITVLASWVAGLNYTNIPAVAVNDLEGKLKGVVIPVNDLAGGYVVVPDVVPVTDLTGAYNNE